MCTLLETFAREAGAGVGRTIVLVLDNAGWHGEAGLNVPNGVRLVFPPPDTPELQPAETPWALVDEPIVNKHVAMIENSTTSSAKDALLSPTNATPSKAGPASIAGQKSPSRSNRPETV